jgi:hypothetical protein
MNKKELEELGWKITDHTTAYFGELGFLTLRYQIDTKRLEITNVDCGTLFDGYCENMEEFEYLFSKLYK